MTSNQIFKWIYRVVAALAIAILLIFGLVIYRFIHPKATIIYFDPERNAIVSYQGDDMSSLWVDTSDLETYYVRLCGGDGEVFALGEHNEGYVITRDFGGQDTVMLIPLRPITTYHINNRSEPDATGGKVTLTTNSEGRVVNASPTKQELDSMYQEIERRSR